MAQHPVYFHLTQKDGLPDIEFYGIVEDHKGFIWLAADKGLYRYDGKEFKNYSHPNKRGLSVFELQLDHKGRIWCNNLTGQYFYVENDSLQLFTDLKTHKNANLANFTFYKKNMVICNFPKLTFIDLDTKETSINIDNTTAYTSFYSKKDTLFYTDTHNVKYTLDGFKNINKYRLPVDSIPPLPDIVNIVHKNRLVHYTMDYPNKKAHLFYENSKKIVEIPLPDRLQDNIVMSIYQEANTLWFCTNKGVIIYYFDKGKLYYKDSYFVDQKVSRTLKDKNNNYWFTTLHNGIYIVPNLHIQKYSLPETTANISAMDKVGNNQLLFGTTNGNLSLFDIDSKQTRNISLKSKEKIFSIRNNSNDTVYISQPRSSFFFSKKYQKLDSNTQFTGAKDLSVINAKNLIYAAYAHASILNFKNDSITYLDRRRTYTSYYSATNKTIYIGYVDGLKQYDQNLKSSTITYNGKPIFAIDIQETNEGTIWVSTFKNGLIGITNNGTIYNYTKENGLLSNQTGTIKSDGDLLWISTDLGLQLLDTKDKTFKNITKKNGIHSFNISDMAIFEDKLFFATNKDLFKVSKHKVFNQSKLHEFYFTKILIEDLSRPIKTNYQLAHDENKIEFQFRTNGFLSEENINYYYRLLGTSDRWTNVSINTNKVTFNSLSAGDYIFQLKAVTINGTEETPIQSIHIKVKLPFYKEWWFILIVFSIIFIVIWKYFSWRITNLEIRQKEALEKEKVNKQLISSHLENLRSQMNPHFIFNALNSIQEYIILNEKRLASTYLVKFSRLIRMYLEHSQEHYISLSKELNALKLYLELEKNRFEDTLNYEILVDKEINTEAIQVPSIFIQPYVENALKHGLLHKTTDRKLKVAFDLDHSKNNLLCIIEDNGIGRKASYKIKMQREEYHRSYATKANQKRIDLINADREVKITLHVEDLYDSHNTPKGTKIHLQIPIE